MKMLLQVLQLASMCTVVYGHGYLSKPMSRTGLNAQVTHTPVIYKSVANYSRPAQIPALSAPFWNQSPHGQTWMRPKSEELVRVVTMLESASTTTSQARTGARSRWRHTLLVKLLMCSGASTTMATMEACLPIEFAKTRTSSTSFSMPAISLLKRRSRQPRIVSRKEFFPALTSTARLVDIVPIVRLTNLAIATIGSPASLSKETTMERAVAVLITHLSTHATLPLLVAILCLPRSRSQNMFRTTLFCLSSGTLSRLLRSI